MNVMKLVRFLAILIMPLMLQACASHDSAIGSKGTGISVTYDASYDKTWDASLEAVNETGGSIVSKDKETGKVAASYGVTAFSWGERVALFVKSIGKKQTEVEVVSKRAVAVNVTAADWEPKIHSKIKDKLTK